METKIFQVKVTYVIVTGNKSLTVMVLWGELSIIPSLTAGLASQADQELTLNTDMGYRYLFPNIPI